MGIHFCIAELKVQEHASTYATSSVQAFTHFCVTTLELQTIACTALVRFLLYGQNAIEQQYFCKVC